MKQGLFEKKPWFLSEPTITREWLVKIKFVERQRRHCDYHDMATARHYFIYEGFSPISISILSWLVNSIPPTQKAIFYEWALICILFKLNW